MILRPLFLILIFLLICFVLPSGAEISTDSQVLAVLRFDNTSGDTRWDNFAPFLEKRIGGEALLPNLSVKSWNITLSELFSNNEAKQCNLRMALSGSFFRGQDSTLFLRFRMMDVKTGNVEEKECPISGMQQEDVAYLVALKTKDLYATGLLLAQLSVSSTPLGLALFLNGTASGKTPKEFFLPSGHYTLLLSGKYLEPYSAELDLVAGKSTTIEPEMIFKGYPTLYFIIGSIVASWESVVFWKAKERYYDEYQKDASFRTDYKQYNYITISMLSLAGIGWSSSLFCYLKNKKLRQQLFSIKK